MAQANSPVHTRGGTRYLTKIPDGWSWMLLSTGNIIISHPDHAPRIFDVETEEWSELDLSKELT
jgi:hypothetical protein